MNALQPDQLAATVISATSDVFATMLGLPVEVETVRKGDDEPDTFDGVVALVGVGGSYTGSGRIYCGSQFACQVAGALVGAEYRNVDEEVLDGIAEVANMIIGNVKTKIEEAVGPLGLSVPTVIFGRNYQARTASVHDWIIVPFRCGVHNMEVRFCIMPSRAPARQQSWKHEPAPA